MPMHQPPLLAVAPEHLGDAQRPVLVGQAMHFAILPLDIGEDDQVVGRIGLRQLERRRAIAEVACQRREALLFIHHPPKLKT